MDFMNGTPHTSENVAFVPHIHIEKILIKIYLPSENTVFAAEVMSIFLLVSSVVFFSLTDNMHSVIKTPIAANPKAALLHGYIFEMVAIDTPTMAGPIHPHDIAIVVASAAFFPEKQSFDDFMTI
jgi:hypothetical protein